MGLAIQENHLSGDFMRVAKRFLWIASVKVTTQLGQKSERLAGCRKCVNSGKLILKMCLKLSAGD